MSLLGGVAGYHHKRGSMPASLAIERNNRSLSARHAIKLSACAQIKDYKMLRFFAFLDEAILRARRAASL